MRLIVAFLLALGLAWFWDRFLRIIKLNQNIRIGIGMPLGEEAIKYLVAGIFQFPPILIYILFGLGEGCLETFLLKKSFDLKLILAGGLTHFFFGLFFILPVPPFLSISLAITIHIFWNILLIKD